MFKSVFLVKVRIGTNAKRSTSDFPARRRSGAALAGRLSGGTGRHWGAAPGLWQGKSQGAWVCAFTWPNPSSLNCKMAMVIPTSFIFVLDGSCEIVCVCHLTQHLLQKQDYVLGLMVPSHRFPLGIEVPW